LRRKAAKPARATRHNATAGAKRGAQPRLPRRRSFLGPRATSPRAARPTASRRGPGWLTGRTLTRIPRRLPRPPADDAGPGTTLRREDPEARQHGPKSKTRTSESAEDPSARPPPQPPPPNQAGGSPAMAVEQGPLRDLGRAEPPGYLIAIRDLLRHIARRPKPGRGPRGSNVSGRTFVLDVRRRELYGPLAPGRGEPAAGFPRSTLRASSCHLGRRTSRPMASVDVPPVYIRPTTSKEVPNAPSRKIPPPARSRCGQSSSW